MRYIVACTKIYNGTLEVEANSEEEALLKAEENIGNCNWVFGEITADYVEKA